MADHSEFEGFVGRRNRKLEKSSAPSGPPRFVLYLRVSPPEELERSFSEEDQRAMALHLAAKKNGTIIAEFCDMQSNGTGEDQPFLEKAIEECVRLRAYLLVATVDRLARKSLLAVQIQGRLNKSKLGLLCHEIEYAFRVEERAASDFAFHMLAAMAEWEVSYHVDRVRAVQDAKVFLSSTRNRCE